MTDGRLVPADDTRLSAAETPNDGEYRSCLESFIAFMRGESADALLIGDGEADTVFAAADELPELRLVCVPGLVGAKELLPLFKILSGQPLKFAVMLDKTAAFELPERLVPANVMMVRSGDDW